MRMDVICILLSIITYLTAYLARGLVIFSSADNKKTIASPAKTDDRIR